MRELIKSRPWLPYVLPFGIYMAFLAGQSNANLLWLYPLKTLAVAVALVMFHREYTELRPGISALAVVVGLVAIVLWIGLDPYYPKVTELMHSFESLLGRWIDSPPPKATAVPPFDPTTIQSAVARNGFIVFRIIGAVLVVPVMEELFWRGFLIRWIVAEDFQSVPLGTFTWKSFAFTTLFFGLEHDQWVAGLICGALYNWLFYRTRNLWACVTAHAVSNAVLAAWVLSRGAWRFW
jgi:membrane protease YdiL (CAAX protease family)